MLAHLSQRKMLHLSLVFCDDSVQEHDCHHNQREPKRKFERAEKHHYIIHVQAPQTDHRHSAWRFHTP